MDLAEVLQKGTLVEVELPSGAKLMAVHLPKFHAGLVPALHRAQGKDVPQDGSEAMLLPLNFVLGGLNSPWSAN